MRRKTVEAYDPAASFDAGNGFLKWVADNNIRGSIRSIHAEETIASQLDGLPYESTITWQGKTYVFGNEGRAAAAGNMNEFTSYHRYTSEWYKCLFAYALFRAFGARQSNQSPIYSGVIYPWIVSSIPAKMHANPKDLARVKKYLVGEYIIGTKQEGLEFHICISPDHLNILPEGAGTYMNLALGSGGHRSTAAYQNGTVCICDIGYGTTDATLYHDKRYVADSAKSYRIGVQIVAEQILREVLPGTADLSAHDVDDVMNCPTYTYMDTPYPIENVREQTLTRLGKSLGNWLTQVVAGHNVHSVVLTGGGAELFARYIPNDLAIGTIEVAHDCRTANVDGAYLWLKAQGKGL